MNLSPVLKQRFFDDDGAPLSGGKLYSYIAGTSTPQATYTDAGGLTPNANPVILDAAGEADVWLDNTLSYKFVLDDSNDVTQWSVDNVIGTLSDDSVTTAALQDGAVTLPKLGADVIAAIATNPANGIQSGAVRSATSNQPAFLKPAGTGASASVQGLATPLVYYVDSVACTISTNVSIAGLTVAPSSNNTCLVNDALATSGNKTRTWGEVDAERGFITVDAMGSNIAALVGKRAAFKIAGTTDEYFIAYVESATKLSGCMRGHFYDDTIVPINRTAFLDNDTITLMSWAHIFASNTGTLAASYTPPVWSGVEPAGAVNNDYWFDIKNQTWKRYNGASFVSVGYTYVGSVVLDSTDCVAGRSYEFFADHQPTNGLLPRKLSNSVAQVRNQYGSICVMGNLIDYGTTMPSWNLATDIVAAPDSYNSTEQASTPYYLYVKDTGDWVISDIEPQHRPDLCGSYHPHNPWRVAGIAWNNASSNIQACAFYDPFHTSPEAVVGVVWDSNAGQSIPDATDTVIQYNAALSSTFAGPHAADAFGMLDSTNYRLVAPVPGYYSLSPEAALAGNGSVISGYLYVLVNGVSGRALRYNNKYSISGLILHMSIETKTWLNAGDYIEVLIQQAAGGAISLESGTSPPTNVCSLSLLRGVG